MCTQLEVFSCMLNDELSHTLGTCSGNKRMCSLKLSKTSWRKTLKKWRKVWKCRNSTSYKLAATMGIGKLFNKRTEQALLWTRCTGWETRRVHAPPLISNWLIWRTQSKVATEVKGIAWCLTCLIDVADLGLVGWDCIWRMAVCIVATVGDFRLPCFRNPMFCFILLFLFYSCLS